MPRIAKPKNVAALSLCCSLLTIAGCGGGGSSDGGEGTSETPSSSELSVTGVTPQDGLNGASRQPSISASFNRDLFGASVNSGSINLSIGGDSVQSDVTLDSSGDQVSLVPEQRLLPLGLYSVAVTTSITDIDGNALASEYTWQFRVRDGSWGNPSAIEGKPGTGGNLQLASGGNGIVAGIWSQDFGGKRVIWASKNFAAQDWSEPQVVSSSETESARFPAISVGSNGSLVAAWEQSASSVTGYEIWANQYIPGNGWQAPTRISAAGVGESPQVVIDSQGNAVAVWYQNDGSRFGVWSSHRSISGSWSSPKQIDNGLGSAFMPSLAKFRSNSVTAVWIQNVNGSDQLYTSEYVSGAGWDESDLVHTATNGITRGPVSIATSENGNEVMAWTQQDNALRRVWSARRDNAGTWQTPGPIAPNQGGNASGPKVAISDEGVAVASWYQAEGTLNNILASRLNESGIWQTPAEIDSNSEGGATNPAITVDQLGNFLVTWNEVEGGLSNIWSARYKSEEGWQSSVLIESSDAGDALGSDVVFDGFGNGVALWQQFNGAAYDIATNTFQ